METQKLLPVVDQLQKVHVANLIGCLGDFQGLFRLGNDIVPKRLENGLPAPKAIPVVPPVPPIQP